jgi:hypothetical protein
MANIELFGIQVNFVYRLLRLVRLIRLILEPEPKVLKVPSSRAYGQQYQLNKFKLKIKLKIKSFFLKLQFLYFKFLLKSF